MVSEEYKKGLEKFKNDMAEAKKSLPSNWVQIILKGKKLKVKEYRKTYNRLVNWVHGRSYRSSMDHPELVQEIITLSNKYKQLEL